jgi:hypothetical protein
MLPITIAGKATGPPPNAITRIAAASTSQGSASRNGMARTKLAAGVAAVVGGARLHGASIPPKAEPSVAAIDKIAAKLVFGR